MPKKRIKVRQNKKRGGREAYLNRRNLYGFSDLTPYKAVKNIKNSL